MKLPSVIFHCIKSNHGELLVHTMTEDGERDCIAGFVQESQYFTRYHNKCARDRNDDKPRDIWRVKSWEDYEKDGFSCVACYVVELTEKMRLEIYAQAAKESRERERLALFQEILKKQNKTC